MIIESTKVEDSTNVGNIAKPMLGEDYGFKIHLLMLYDNEYLTHVNTYYDWQDLSGIRIEESQNRLKKVVICNSQIEIDCAIGNYNADLNPSKTLYIFTNIYDYETIKQYK